MGPETKTKLQLAPTNAVHALPVMVVRERGFFKAGGSISSSSSRMAWLGHYALDVLGHGRRLGYAAQVRNWLDAHGYAPESVLPSCEEARRLRDLRPAAVFVPSPYGGHRPRSLAPARRP